MSLEALHSLKSGELTMEERETLAVIKGEFKRRGEPFSSDEVLIKLVLKLYMGRVQMQTKSNPPLMVEVCNGVEKLRLSDPKRFTVFEQIRPTILEMTPTKMDIDNRGLAVHGEIRVGEIEGFRVPIGILGWT